MEQFEVVESKMEDQKKRRKRYKPQKKWTDEEHNLLLDYLFENVDIEKPTAHIYYKKLIEKTKIDATCDMVRCKVRYLKQSFNKAEEWRKSTGAGLDVDDECSTIKEKLNKMCPHYGRLSELFRDKSNVDVVEESLTYCASGNLNCSYEISTTDFAECVLDTSELFTVVDNVIEVSPSMATAQSSPLVKPVPEYDETAKISATSRGFGKKLKTRMPKNSLSELAAIQRKRDEFLEKRLCIEQEKVEIEKGRLEVDKERLCKEFEIKKLELEQKERLAIMELKYKYSKE